MSTISNIQTGLTKTLSRGGLILRHKSPELLLGAGIVGVIATAVLASKATLKAGAIIEESKSMIEKVHEARDLADESTYTKEDYSKDLALVYVKTGLNFAKLYAPAVGMGVLSIALILTSHGVIKRRNVALLAAYNLINDSYSSYRSRVVADLGEDADRLYRLGIKEETVTETDEQGTKTQVKKMKTVFDAHSDYAKFFDEYSDQWRKDPTMNLVFLKAQQNYANDLLKSRGHLFLNEVYDMLGIPRTQAGTIVGWIYDPSGDALGDNFVDFNIYNVDNSSSREFVNGYNRSILLDFNVDGVIWDLI